MATANLTNEFDPIFSETRVETAAGRENSMPSESACASSRDALSWIERAGISS
jgi:hypothetical protein